MFGLALLMAQAMQSPWWEDYAIKDRYLCHDKGMLVIERNQSQASLISGGYRRTFFRLQSNEPGVRYSSDGMEMILLGDELTLEQLPMRMQCLRVDQV